MAIHGKERQVLRDLAKRVAGIAALPVMGERRQMWKRHNTLERAAINRGSRRITM